MSHHILMPALSPTMEKGTLARWLVAVGDVIEPGKLIAEIETDKATMELEAAYDGVVARLLVEEGTEDVAVGTPIFELAANGDEISERPAHADNPESAEVETGSVPLAAPPVSSDPGSNSPDKIGGTRTGSPLALAIADLRGLDLGSYSGSGQNGRVKWDDLGLRINRRENAPEHTSATPDAPAPTPTFGAPGHLRKLSRIRRVAADRLSLAKREIPHFYQTVSCRFDALLALRAQLNSELELDGSKISVNDLLIKALATALARVPEANVAYAGKDLMQFSRVDISVAVATENGIVTPVIRDAARSSVLAISTAMALLVESAREKKLAPEDYSGGTASLSNLGMHGITQFDAVINPPQGVILAIGATEERFVPVEGEPRIVRVANLTGSFDHRAIDGVDAARLMVKLRDLIEDPLRIVA